ncbi:hypothetical protein UlMin_044405 [Ulmus minor]
MMATKIRLVRCPKCRLVLPELPEFNVYKCGGCGTTLQAKRRVNDAKSTSSGSTDVDGAVLKKQSCHVHEDEGSCSSSIKDVLPGSGEDCSDENNGRDQGGSEECESQSSHVHEDEGSFSSSIKDVLPGSGEDCSDENNERDQDRSGECDSEQLGVVNLSAEDQSNGRHQSDFSDCQREPSGVSNKVFPSTESDNVNEELADDKNEMFDHNRNGEVSNNGNEEVAYNGNEQIADNGSEDQSNGSHQSDSSDCQSEPSGVSNKVFPSTESDDVNEELADDKNEKFDHNGNGEVSNNGNEEVAYNGNEQIADNGREEFSHSENEEFSDNGNKGIDDNGNEEFAHDNETESASADTEVAANNESLQLAEADSEVAANDESLLSSEEDSEIAANNESLLSSEEDSEIAANDESLPLAEADSEVVANDESLPLAEADSEAAANDEILSSSEADSELAANDESLPLAEADSEVSANDDSLPLAEADSEVSANDESLPLAEADSEVSANDESLSSTEADSEVAAKDESLSSAEADSEVAAKDESLPLEEENTTYNNKNFDSDSNFRSSNNISLVAPVENGSIVSVQKLVRESRESIPFDTLASTPSEHLEESQTSVQQGFNPLGSVITSDNAEFNPSSEFSGAFRDMYKSPTRSSHAYDGSISSFDGMDDQFPNHHTHSFQDTYNAVNFAHSAEIRRRDELRAKSVMNRDSELQNQARHSCSDMDRKWGRDEYLKAARYGHMVQNRTGSERDEYRSRLNFGRASFQGSYENGGPSQLRDKFYHHKPSFQSYDGSEDPELDKLKLLRMVFELQEQLKNTRHLHEKENGFSGDARYLPRYRNYKSPSEELFQHSNYLRYTGRYTAGSNYSQRHRSKKIPFSGEATSSSHQYDSSFSHCPPEDWQRSAQLPRPSLYYNSGLCRIHPGHNYCTCYSSAPPSPQWSVETDIWGHETKSGDQRRGSQEVKSYLREKQHLTKRHFRPISGAAPFVACYNCFRVLQLPADFLLFKRRCHKLRCGACLMVLEFSLQNRSHIVPYTFNAEDPPTSEAEDDHGDFVRRTSASASQVRNYTQHQRADPVSCSDDYGLSYCRSCSTEGEPVYNTPSHTPQQSASGGRFLNGSFNPKRDGEALSSQQSREKYKKPVVGYETGSPSSSKFKSEKSPSEIEELPQRPTSPLHRLMGYSSPSEVIYGAGKSGQGTSS